MSIGFDIQAENRFEAGWVTNPRPPIATEEIDLSHSQGEHGHEDQYVVARALEVLASDERVGETSLHVSVSGKKLFVTGDVATDDRRRMITTVLEETFPDCEIANATSVYDMVETTEEERL